MPWGVIAAGIGAVSGIGNLIANSSANDRAAMLQSEAMKQWLAINVPDPAQQQIVMEKFVNQGQLDPILQKAISQNPSEFQKIVTNPGYSAAQDRALSQLEDIGNQGGLRLQDKAAIQEATLEGQAKERANRQAIASNMEQRGLGGSGFEAAAQLQGQQGVADQTANASLKTAADAQARALAAIEQGGTLATSLRGQDFGEQAQKAGAADAINRFNTQNLQNVNAANTGMANRDQELNLANNQRISDQNTQLSNNQQLYNKGLVQQKFNNEVTKAQGATGQSNQQAATAQRGGQITGNAISNIGTGIAGGATAQANSDFWDNYFKKKNGSSDTTGSP